MIGILGDLHGDTSALEWALQTLSDSDRLVSVGDVVASGPDPACLERLRDRGVEVVLGNQDLAAARSGRFGVEWSEWLGKLPLEISLGPDLLVTHSMHQDGVWTMLDGEDSVREALARYPQKVVVVGHTHLPCINVLHPDGSLTFVPTPRLREWGRVSLPSDCRYLVNAGTADICVVALEPGWLEYRFRS